MAFLNIWTGSENLWLRISPSEKNSLIPISNCKIKRPDNAGLFTHEVNEHLLNVNQFAIRIERPMYPNVFAFIFLHNVLMVNIVICAARVL